MTKKISIILPVYREEEVIASFHQALCSVINQLSEHYTFEIIYVLDKSPDHTLDILKRIAAEEERVRVLALSKRFGHQMSLVSGLDACTGDAAIMMDCDLEHPPALIVELLEQYEAGFHIVNTRRIYGEKVSFFKKVSSELYYRLLNSLSNEEMREGYADYRLVSREVINVFSKEIREQNQYLRGLFSWVGFSQTTVEFKSTRRTQGKSKYTLKKLVNFASTGLISFSKVPLRTSLGVGIVFAALSILYGIYAIFEFFTTGIVPQGWTSLIVLVGFTSGMQLVTLGVIGLYIGAIFDEVKNRPLYIVEKEYSKIAQKLDPQLSSIDTRIKSN
jgi:dolichol-phosphate mannosyltransferase